MVSYAIWLFKIQLAKAISEQLPLKCTSCGGDIDISIDNCIYIDNVFIVNYKCLCEQGHNKCMQVTIDKNYNMVAIDDK